MKHGPADAEDKPLSNDQDPFAGVQGLSDLIDAAFTEAARSAVEENDRLGIVTHGARDGQLTNRMPPRQSKIST